MADVFLSAPIIDNQPMSILEAYRSGLLVISSNVGGVPYMVEDGKSGYLFESENYQELAHYMIEAVRNQQKSLAMIQYGNMLLENHTWESIKEKLFNCYK